MSDIWNTDPETGIARDYRPFGNPPGSMHSIELTHYSPQDCEKLVIIAVFDADTKGQVTLVLRDGKPIARIGPPGDG